jgi:hypothetical protein
VAALVVLAAALLAGAGGCGDDSRGGGVALDGSPRVPDAEGVVAAIGPDFSTLTLEGGRTYRIPKDVQSFSTIDGSTQPLRRRVDQYVHVGLDGDTMVWIAGISAVIDTGGTKAVYYGGELRNIAGSRLEFTDGTVLRVAKGVTVPAEAEGKRVLATIDPQQRVIVTLVPQ